MARRTARRQHPDPERHDVRGGSGRRAGGRGHQRQLHRDDDAVICDQSVTSIEDLAGRTVAAEQGVVDHFLLLQGLDSAGLTEDDIDFRGCSPARLPPGSRTASSTASACSPPSHSPPSNGPARTCCSTALTAQHHLRPHRGDADLIEDRPEDVQALVDSWYATLDYIDAHPEESLEILAAAADITTDEYESLAEGTTIFSAEEALKSFEDGDDTTSLLYTARLISLPGGRRPDRGGGQPRRAVRRPASPGLHRSERRVNIVPETIPSRDDRGTPLRPTDSRQPRPPPSRDHHRDAGPTPPGSLNDCAGTSRSVHLGLAALASSGCSVVGRCSPRR